MHLRTPRCSRLRRLNYIWFKGQHALEDTTLPFVGRLLQAGDELSKGWIWSGAVGAFSGKLAWEAIKQAFANDRKLTEAIGECKKKYPLAEHRIPFFTI
jgi:hypothetical protein